ncbi:MAG: PIN domain-containing protein [Gemmataceae bacterium]
MAPMAPGDESGGHSRWFHSCSFRLGLLVCRSNFKPLLFCTEFVFVRVQSRSKARLMESSEFCIFIDTNRYLDLYRIKTGKTLLHQLLERRDHILIPRQVVNEIDRRKLDKAREFLLLEVARITHPQMAIPDHLFEAQLKEKYTKALNDLGDKAKKLKAEILETVSKTLRQISHSNDEVSISLQPLFEMAVDVTPNQLQRARLRKELGNPPGKAEQTLGDQVCWEQLLDLANKKKKVWIVSSDADYLSKFEKEYFLNPLLYRELKAALGNDDIFCFDDIIEALKHFAKETKLPINKPLKEEEEKEIHRQLQEIRPSSPIIIVPGGMDGGVYSAIASSGVVISGSSQITPGGMSILSGYRPNPGFVSGTIGVSIVQQPPCIPQDFPMESLEKKKDG